MQNSKTAISPKEYCNLYYYRQTRLLSLAARYFLLLLSLSFYACSTTKNQIYFKDLPRDTLLNNVVGPDYEIKIRKGDVLSVTVNSLSPDVGLYNSSPSGSASSVTTGTTSSGSAGLSPTAAQASGGYPVDENGNIEFPKLGMVHVDGMTRKQLKDSLQNLLVPYLKEAIVTVAFQNRHITMIGGVSTSVIPMNYDNMTLLDALAASGDIGEKGKIDNILVIRDTAGAKSFKRLSLRDHSIFSSPYFYMQPNDVVYVEPQTPKTPLTPIQVVSLVTGAASVLTILITLITKL